jgi:hypothetical protein
VAAANTAAVGATAAIAQGFIGSIAIASIAAVCIGSIAISYNYKFLFA